MVKVKFCGASGGEVTGSKFLVSSNKSKILLDCGLFQGKRSESIIKNSKFSFNPSDLDACIISHAHIDHTGALPLLVKNGFCNKIYMTNITQEISHIMLLDSAKLQKEDAEFYNKIHRNEYKVNQLYDEADVEETFKSFKSIKRNMFISITEDFYCKFSNAGHVLGSSSIYVNVENTKILYTGDIGRRKQFILNPPSFECDVDYLIIESTYGGREHPEPIMVYEKFKDLIRKAVERESKIIIPSFSLERTQEIVNVFDRIRHDENIPKIPLYVDSPMSVKITDIFNKYINEEDYSEEFKKYARKDRDPFGYDYIFYISSQHDSKKLNSAKGPMVIISASGMCEGGRVLHHIRNSIDNPNNILLLVGYQALNTCGRKLKDGSKKVKIFGIEHEVCFEVHSIDFFSSHASSSDLVSYIENIKPKRGIFLVHGENEQREALKSLLVEKGFKNVFLPDFDEEIILS
ncbi:MAG: MBL fold metallo-hydrolase [Elusimicrobiales bacterium]|nr:MBL fold metallo-hydrolase [Elusimicrobiales bacterium]